MTIAGGPPPAKQNFRPKISVPVIGRNLRARIASKSESGAYQCGLKNSEHVELPTDAASIVEVSTAIGDPCSSQVGTSRMTAVDSISESGGTTLYDISLIDQSFNGNQDQGTAAICRKDENNQDSQGVGVTLQHMNNSVVPCCTGVEPSIVFLLVLCFFLS